MRVLAAAALAWAAGTISAAWAQPAFDWPNGARAAIVLTYDDALVSQLDNVVPQLDAAGLKGTFFLMGRSMTPDSVPRWRAVAEAGHELGNHTINHPCARGSFDMPAQYNSESYSLETMLTEANVMNTLLTALDGKPTHTFATPCGQNLVGGGEDYVGPLQAAGLASYVRDTRGSIPVPAERLPAVFAIGFTDVSGAEMIAWAEQVRAAGGLGIVVFHGVGGDHLAVSAEAHQELVNHLAAHRDAIWTARYDAAMDYVVAQAGE